MRPIKFRDRVNGKWISAGGVAYAISKKGKDNVMEDSHLVNILNYFYRRIYGVNCIDILSYELIAPKKRFVEYVKSSGKIEELYKEFVERNLDGLSSPSEIAPSEVVVNPSVALKTKTKMARRIVRTPKGGKIRYNKVVYHAVPERAAIKLTQLDGKRWAFAPHPEIKGMLALVGPAEKPEAQAGLHIQKRTKRRRLQFWATEEVAELLL